MCWALVTEWVHTKCAHSKPYAPCVVKPWEVGINVTPLCCICRVPKLAIFLIIKLLSAFGMPMQELGLLSCCEPSSQLRNDAKIPCVIEPPKLIPYYCLNHSTWPLSNNIEVTCRLCRVKPGKSLTSQDRQLYIKTHTKANPEINK
jgi:hypothetical protein